MVGEVTSDSHFRHRRNLFLSSHPTAPVSKARASDAAFRRISVNGSRSLKLIDTETDMVTSGIWCIDPELRLVFGQNKLNKNNYNPTKPTSFQLLTSSTDLSRFFSSKVSSNNFCTVLFYNPNVISCVLTTFNKRIWWRWWQHAWQFLDRNDVS